MAAIFLKLFNMSITAGWLVLAVILLRLLFKKFPKWLCCIMWAFVGIRLICPFSFESVFSLIPSTEIIPPDIFFSESPQISSGIPVLNTIINPVISEALAPEVGASINPVQIIISAASIIWIIGVLVMLIYMLISYLLIYRKVREAVWLKDNIWLCDYISTPFILGIFRPRIFLPSTMMPQDMEPVIAHERAHISRHDHWWKPLGFALLTVYWFNPLMWLSYILLCRDIELACDESVIKRMEISSRKAYSNALINCSTTAKIISVCPLAFGEISVKERVRIVLNYRKPAFWIISASVCACIIIALCFLTNPSESDKRLPTYTSDGLVYKYPDSVDPIEPVIVLYEDDDSFQFSYSGFSSYIAFGKYEIKDNTLTLRTDDGLYTYIFSIKEDTMVFDASVSSMIPKYRYSEASYNTECPVPDGAVFELINPAKP